MSNQQPDKRTASQRIDDLEMGLRAMYQTAENMARDMGTIKEAIKLLGNKMDSIVKASNNGEKLTDEVIARIMVENNVEELRNKVTDLVNQGFLAKGEEITLNSFVVGRELAEDGTIQNPRMQFVVSALAEQVRNKFPGQKSGDILTLEEGKWKFEIQEVYNIQTPPPPQAEAAPEVTPEVSQEAAPAQETVETPQADS